MSSLSSQSPPSSPFITPSAEAPPPLLPAQPAHPTDLSLSQHETEKVDKAAVAVGESQHLAGVESEPGPGPLGQSEDDLEGFGQSLISHWEPRAWPEGRQVLTHLVEGFVIQEGLQPFPVRTHTNTHLRDSQHCQTVLITYLFSVQVNRSSLLVPEQVAKPQQVNGTNGKAALPVTEATKQPEHSTDSEQEEAGDTDDPANSKSLMR